MIKNAEDNAKKALKRIWTNYTGEAEVHFGRWGGGGYRFVLDIVREFRGQGFEETEAQLLEQIEGGKGRLIVLSLGKHKPILAIGKC